MVSLHQHNSGGLTKGFPVFLTKDDTENMPVKSVKLLILSKNPP
jgi:hypothetical protein